MGEMIAEDMSVVAAGPRDGGLVVAACPSADEMLAANQHELATGAAWYT